MKIRVCGGLFHFINFHQEKMLTGFLGAKGLGAGNQRLDGSR
jgi:hypothetical protein